ncbi:hypothetical protein ACFYVL_19700 [Streptomyces sp. NPDC004111]|uniref:hypothetical protein n=1 Tax=Streptomyces sp. NPDC004111 TaxID=3364690 RepID=UPI0036CB7326
MGFGSSEVGGELLRAVAEFEAGVAARDAELTGSGFDAIRQTFGQAGPAEVRECGPRLAALLTSAPEGVRAVVAVIVGACVERGADAGLCAPGVFAGMREAFEDVAEFCALWEESGGGTFPDPEEPGQGPDGEAAERTGFGPALAWWTLPQWQMAAFALLNEEAGRGQVPCRGELLALLARIEWACEERGGPSLKGLRYALRVLDGEPLVVLHRESSAGFLVRIGGIGDNFQLHTLLADALVGGGHLPGTPPSAEAVAVCRDVEGQVLTQGSFNLVGADGAWIWNEGDPADIPPVNGTRVLVLDPEPYARSWPAGRYFPGMRGGLVVERVLSRDESRTWLSHTTPAQTG